MISEMIRGVALSPTMRIERAAWTIAHELIQSDGDVDIVCEQLVVVRAQLDALASIIEPHCKSVSGKPAAKPAPAPSSS